MTERDPRDEATEGAWTGVLLLTFTGLAFVAACVIFPPTRLIFSSNLSDPGPSLNALLLRCALFLGLLMSATGLLAWERHRRRRAARAVAAEPRSAAAQLVARPAAGDCPFCHDALATQDLGEGVVRCPGCEVAHHAACWREHGGCSTLGCRRDPRQRDTLRARTGE